MSIHIFFFIVFPVVPKTPVPDSVAPEFTVIALAPNVPFTCKLPESTTTLPVNPLLFPVNYRIPVAVVEAVVPKVNVDPDTLPVSMPA